MLVVRIAWIALCGLNKDMKKKHNGIKVYSSFLRYTCTFMHPCLSSIVPVPPLESTE